MEEKSKTEETTEVQQETAEEVQQPETFVSKSQEVADLLEEQQEEQAFGKPETEEVSKESEKTEEVLEKSEATEETEKVESSTTEEPDKKDNVQKRIDQLTAEKKKAEEDAADLKLRLEKLEGKDDKEVKPEDKVYTREQLAQATKKFMDEGDADGMMDVFEYMVDQRAKKEVSAFEKKETEVKSARDKMVQELNTEWAEIADEYNPEKYVEAHPTLAKDPDFDIKNEEGALFSKSKSLYEGARAGSKYFGIGGMKKAVQDVFNELVLGLVSGKKTKPASKLKDVKDVRKKSLGSGASDAGMDSTPVEISPKSDLDDYMEERNKDKASKMEASV